MSDTRSAIRESLVEGKEKIHLDLFWRSTSEEIASVEEKQALVPRSEDRSAQQHERVTTAFRAWRNRRGGGGSRAKSHDRRRDLQ